MKPLRRDPGGECFAAIEHLDDCDVAIFPVALRGVEFGIFYLPLSGCRRATMRPLSTETRVAPFGREFPARWRNGLQLAAVYAALALIAAVLFGTLSFHPF
jgi:hypothetical protein